MNKHDLLTRYPAVNFSQKFDEKQSAFVNLGYEINRFKEIKNQYVGILEYDSLVGKLRDSINEIKIDIFDITISSRVVKHFSRISQLCNFLNQLNASDSRDVSHVFRKFNELLSENGYTGNIVYNIGGVTVNSNETLLSKYIEDVSVLIREIIGQEQSKLLKTNLDEFNKKIISAERIAENIIANESKYERAQKVAENWIKTEGIAITSTVQDKAQIFRDKANNEHKGFWIVWSWLIGVLMFIFGAIFSSIILINKLSSHGESISVGAALLRVSVVGMFFYMAFLCYQQFSVQRRLYEVYKFKAIALSTMESLISSSTERIDRELIINKAIDIIFSEPSFKEDKVAHQRVIDELLDVIKKKI